MDGEDQTLLNVGEEARMGRGPDLDRIRNHIIGFELGPYLGMPTLLGEGIEPKVAATVTCVWST